MAPHRRFINIRSEPDIASLFGAVLPPPDANGHAFPGEVQTAFAFAGENPLRHEQVD